MMAIKSRDVNLGEGTKNQESAGEQGRGASLGRAPLAQRTERLSRTPLSSDLLTRDPTQFAKTKITLPVSKKGIELTLREIDPDETWVSPLNPRNQELLSEDDPELRTFRKKIQDETQRDPVLARVNPGPNGEQFEIIYGSRRRFVAKLEKGTHGAFLLKANIGDIGDADAARLARAENDDRTSLSPYERACDYAKQKQTTYREYDQGAVAAVFGISQSSLSLYLTLAKVPVRVVSVFISPSVIALRDGGKILQALEGLSEQALFDLIEGSIAAGKLERVSAFIALCNQRLQDGKRKGSSKVAANRSVEYGDKKARVTGKLALKRGKKGEYRIDLAGLEKEDIDRLDTFLSQFCR